MNVQQIKQFLELSLQETSKYEENDNIPPSQRYSVDGNHLASNITLLLKLLESDNETN